MNPNPIFQKRRAGICFPLWSLLHEDSFECGDFLTLERILPFLKKSGLQIVQILPLNDCGLGQSPYNSLSGFAMDPLYISLHKAGIPLKSRKKTIATHSINKQRITEWKLKVLWEKFHTEFSKLHHSLEEFISQYSWLKPYLTFKYYYKKHNGIHWLDWEKKEGLHGYEDKLYESLIANESSQKQILFEAWLQYLCFHQLKEIKQIYEENGLYLKGDMPILTSPNSCDVWLYRDCYRLDLQAGAPPDAFSKVGQNWGFPVLDWSILKKKDYSLWKDKLQYQEKFFHLYRIDHVIGLYRIWAIPKNAPNARYGYFYPQEGIPLKEFEKLKISSDICLKKGLVTEIQPGRFIFHWDFHLEPGFQDFTEAEKNAIFQLSFGNLPKDETSWRELGEENLKAFANFTSMAPCAEDLGTVPGFIRESLEQLEIFGIDVIRWTRSFDDGSMIPAKAYRKNAISTLSTHDTSIALSWFYNEVSFEERKKLREFFLENTQKSTLNSKEENPIEDLALMVDFAFQTNSQICIPLLSDLLISYYHRIPDDWHLHRINTPATPEEKNWKYRFNFTAESLGEDLELVQTIQEGLKKSHRWNEN